MFNVFKLIILVVSATPCISIAGEYKLTVGSGIEVCEAYKAALNSTKPKTAMICGRHVGKNPDDISQPYWVKPQDGLLKN